MTTLKEFEDRLRGEPDNLGLRVTLAAAYREAGRLDDAVELYRSAAVAYRNQGRTQQAVSVCRSILAIAPDDASCRVLLASLLGAPGADEPAERPTPPPLDPPPQIAPRGTASLAATTPELRPTPPPLGPPPVVPGAAPPIVAPIAAPVEVAAPVDPIADDEPTPLPAPLPYHVADPTRASVPAVTLADLPPSLREELATYPEVAGIARAAGEISAALIAAHDAGDGDEPIDRATLRRIPTGAMDTIAELSPFALTGAGDHGDDEPTLPPAAVVPDLPDPPVARRPEGPPPPPPPRSKPPSIAPPSSASGPLTTALFAPVPPQHRAALLARFRRRQVPAGTTVIWRGEVGHGLVLVLRGRLELHAAGAERLLAVIGSVGPGDYVGEASLLARTAASAHVVAAVDSELLVLGAHDFYEVTATFPALAAELRATAARRG
jgi:hypothetical protein